jgi:KaiC/GvpD/RAD55 family RecA-like ATPase
MLQAMSHAMLDKPALQFHPELIQRLRLYVRRPIAHVLLYGPPGCGKFTLAKLLIAMHAQVAPSQVYKLQAHVYEAADREFRFLKSTCHFELDVAHFVGAAQQKALVEIVRELSKTMNVARNAYKIILLRNAQALSRSIQHQLRRMLETMYATARLILVSTSVDIFDDTLQSRLVTLRVSAVPTARLSRMLYLLPSISLMPDEMRAIVCDSDNNITASLLKCVLFQLNLPDEPRYIADQLWDIISTQTNPVLTIREYMRTMNALSVQWSDILRTIVARLLTKHSNSFDRQRIVLETWQYFTYMHAIQNNRELPLEQFLTTLASMLKHKRFEQPSSDWV